MKKLLLTSLMVMGFLLSAPAWSHHAAEGIVSDDIWEMVDDMLTEADSPHMDLDFDTMGRPSLVVSFVVYDDEVDDFILAIGSMVDDLNRGASTVLIVTEDVGGGMTEIMIYEPIGGGESQVPPDVGS